MNITVLIMHPNTPITTLNLSLSHCKQVGTALDMLNQMGVDTQGKGVSVYGKKVDKTFTLKPSDRLEICQPLIQSPNQARLSRMSRTSS